MYPIISVRGSVIAGKEVYHRHRALSSGDYTCQMLLLQDRRSLLPAAQAGIAASNASIPASQYVQAGTGFIGVICATMMTISGFCARICPMRVVKACRIVLVALSLQTSLVPSIMVTMSGSE